MTGGPSDAAERVAVKLAELAATLSADELRVLHDVVHLAGGTAAGVEDLDSRPALEGLHDHLHGDA